MIAAHALLQKSIFCLLLSVLGPASVSIASDLSVGNFTKRAIKGEPLRVAFLGGSLTWGANSSDPQTSSYRGLVMRYLQDKYPKTPFIFFDASIGGTGSQLAMFRLNRDVLSNHPDLVFLDFTVNDADNPRCLASYEHIVRELLNSGCMVVPVLMGFKWHVTNPGDPLPSLLQKHLELAAAYHLPAVDTVSYLRASIKKGLNPASIWNINGDGAHPGDEGYRLFFEAVRSRLEQAQTETEIAAVPARPVFEELYNKVTRHVLIDENLPQGWSITKTYRTSLWFDGLPSRWMGEVASAQAKTNPAALETVFWGSMVGILGQRNGITPPIRVWIDGKPVPPPKAKTDEYLWNLDTSLFAPRKNGTGNLILWQPIANGLSDGQHSLRIEPVWTDSAPEAELCIESVCSAGR